MPNNNPHNALRRAVNRAIANGAPVYVNKPKIITDHIRPPIPTNKMDWCAWREGEEENGGYGYGATEQEAIADLLDNEDE